MLWSIWSCLLMKCRFTILVRRNIRNIERREPHTPQSRFQYGSMVNIPNRYNYFIAFVINWKRVSLSLGGKRLSLFVFFASLIRIVLRIRGSSCMMHHISSFPPSGAVFPNDMWKFDMCEAIDLCFWGCVHDFWVGLLDYRYQHRFRSYVLLILRLFAKRMRL